MLDQIASAFLFFSHDLIIIPLLILGFIWLDRENFYHAVCLVLLSMLLNVALKVSFQVPLAASLGKKGFAFPSGHMQLVTILYTWFAFKIPKLWFRLLILSLLIGIGLSLVHFGYHNYYDVFAGAFFAILLLVSYNLATLRWPKTIPPFLLAAATFFLFYIYWRTGEIQAFVWMAYYTLWGIVVAEQLVPKKMFRMLGIHKLLATLVCLSAILIVHSFFRFWLPVEQPLFVYQLQWLVIGFLLPFVHLSAITLANQLLKKRI